ncbi:MAG: response regulator receiver sensor signal transduction histidine kinase [Candidatus Magnetoglobus multicellularis str. Araruama]|uniref:histidine kinase n=1 Tax=Candidatus Magnetoglobus multicellularis str. Araruama TaxID=890399 RepID=A0A1V1P1T1_9BACT|nr:MAG: response regulator receiver sensor signal transduction histidine kinase [Candidatus Magnetoglobus multicellularis str. Araruama]
MPDVEKIQHELLHNDKLHSVIDQNLWSSELMYPDAHILVVDDLDLNRKLYVALLKRRNAIVYEAVNGEEAVNIFKERPISLILMDLNMPVKNGFEATYEIKKYSRDSFVPIIICTAYASDDILAKAQACGADDLLKKPVKTDIFITKINTMLRLKEFYTRQQKLSQQLQQEVDERKAANERLIAFQKELEALVEKKTHELRQKDMDLLEMDRITSIYTLAAGMAHEINNPLGFIQSSIDSLNKEINRLLPDTLEKSGTAQKIDRLIHRAQRGIKRISHLIDSLKYLANINKNDCLPININKSIDETIQLMGSQANDQIEFITDLGHLPEMTCICTEIHLCLMNIIRNAQDAVDKQGKIYIQTRYDKNNETIAICVEDNGPGISKKHLRQVFDPFFTTKPVGHGTGVGLALSERIVRRHGGKIVLDSQPGRGTSVTIHLPLANIENRNE